MLAPPSNVELLRAFFETILPEDGFKCAVAFDRERPLQRFFATPDDLAAFILEQDAAGKTVYHACASFKTAENRKTGKRIASASLLA